MRKNIYKGILTGALAAVMLCTPVHTAKAAETQNAQTDQTAEAQQTNEQAAAQDTAAASYTVTFDANKGKKVTKTLTLAAGDTYGTLPKATRSGYKFQGWYTKKQGGTKVTAASVFGSAKDQVLYAHWKKQVVTKETDTKELAEAPDVLVEYSCNVANAYKQNDYSSFLVLHNFKADYLYCQFDYDRFIGSSGKNVGCTATADAMLASIYMDKPFSPQDEGWISGVGATWTNSVVVAGSKSYSVKKQCQAVYDYLNEGKPVLIRVVGHSVTAIGVREGVARDDLTPADILIADPADAKVKCASEMGWRVMTGSNGWGLRIPKEGLVPAE